MKKSSAKTLIATLGVLITFGVICFFTIMLLPLKNVTKNTLQAKMKLPLVVKNVPVVNTCSKPSYTELIPDCGAGACPLIYEISYKTRAQEKLMTTSLDDYITSLKEPYKYTLQLDTNVTEDTPCSEVGAEVYSVEE